MKKNDFFLPKGWELPRGYSQGIITEGKQIFISGQIGWDETSTFQSDDFAEQAGQALRNIMSILGRGQCKCRTYYKIDLVHH